MNKLCTLVTSLDQLDVKLMVRGRQLLYAPTSAVTPSLHAGIKQHKANLLVLLSPAAETADKADDGQADLTSPWQSLVAHIAMYGWTFARSDEGTDSDEFATPLPPSCPTCDLWEMWQTLAGTWRCQHCDPPIVAQQLRERAAEIRRK